ncbi:Cytochrome P450 [Popillia japonica]|uniref:Cytochrome P450 n=1 Tax=Popillia japonica TaxID=7064 RepID=A0AAW1ME81_POPJA
MSLDTKVKSRILICLFDATADKTLKKATTGTDIRLPIVGTKYKLFGIKREDFFSVAIQYVLDNAPIFCTWHGSTPEIGIVKPEYFEIVTNNAVHIKKGRLYKLLLPWLGEGLLTSTGNKWHLHRRLITPAFHFKILESFMDVFVEKTQTLLTGLDGMSTGEPFNIYPYITECALDVICETAMGVPINAMKNKENPYVKSVYIISELILGRFIKPIPEFIYKHTSQGRLFQRTLESLHQFSDKVIAERKEALRKSCKCVLERKSEDDIFGRKKRLSFLDMLLEASEDGKIISDRELREEVNTFMFAGHDTTTANICWNLFLLGNYPEIQELVFEEVHSILNDKLTPTSISELSEMKYLECVIKETLRLYPSMPVIMRQLEQEITLGEYKIPATANITLHIYALHRSPEIYPNPNKFDPERFFPENTQNRHPYAYVPFSAGARNCIGQKFALYEEKTILSSLINRYKIVAIETPEKIRMAADLVLRPINGTVLKLERRVFGN